MILFSIIVPTYNRADLICETLDSLLKQTFTDFEIIIVDDGSTDNTQLVVEKYLGDKVRYFKKDNAERAAARNFGASKARGEYVNFFDSDDIALPNHISEAAKLIKELQNVNWFHLSYAWANPQRKIFKEVNDFNGSTLNSIMHKGNPLSCNGVFIKRDILLNICFNEDRDLSASEDYELWCRLAARYPLYYSTTITSLVIDHDERSVRKINGQKLIKRLTLLIEYLEKDEKVVEYFKTRMDTIKMDSYSYIALHLANVSKYKFRSIFYLIKGMRCSFSILRTKRFYATLKNLIIKW